jgi:hypothetical protein
MMNRVGGIMVIVLASSVVDSGLEPRSGQTKDFKIGICRFSAKHASIKKEKIIVLARNQNNTKAQKDHSKFAVNWPKPGYIV